MKWVAVILNLIIPAFPLPTVTDSAWSDDSWPQDSAPSPTPPAAQPPKHQSLDALEEEFVRLNRQVEDEVRLKMEVERNPDYALIVKQLEELTAKRDAYLAVVPDSMPMLEALKIQIIQALTENRIDHFKSIRAKFRQEKKVNGSMLLNALGGDIGIFTELAKISQKALNDFAKENPDMKNELKQCIQVVGQKMVDLEMDFTFGR